MKITTTTSLQELQQTFQEEYPFLKIEFYKKPHEDEQGSPAKEQLKPNVSAAEAGLTGKGGTLTFTDDDPIGEFESRMEEQFGLNMQVFRKSGNLWLQTSTTDHWTLAEANGKGKRSVDQYNEMHK